MSPLARALSLLSLTSLTTVTAAAQPPTAQSADAGLAQRERELAVVRHVREHLSAPGDGVALAADRADLRSVAADAARAGGTGPLDGLSVVVAVWQARVNERTPFALMGRAALDQLLRAQRSLDSVATGLPDALRQRLVPAFAMELDALRAQLTGGGELPDDFIDRALSVADAAAAGRPAPYAGVGPTTGSVPMPRPPMPYPAPPGSRVDNPTSPYGPYATPPPGNPNAPASGTGSGSPLPPGLAAFSSPASGGGGGGGCSASRAVASTSGTTDSFLRVAECWSRQRMWPGWAAQVVEALDWATDAAVITRDCAGLDAVARQMGALGGGPTPFPDDRLRLVDLRRRIESERSWLRSVGACRY